jgi:methionine synthase II (cobalamin-independent)
MKVIHINTFDIRGGAARAAYRIHSALKNVGVDSTMIVSKKDSQDKDINIYNIPFLDKKMSITRKILSLQKDINRTYHTCNFFYSGISKVINNSDADIIHLHWIGNEMISIKEISEIKKKWSGRCMICGHSAEQNIMIILIIKEDTV